MFNLMRCSFWGGGGLFNVTVFTVYSNALLGYYGIGQALKQKLGLHVRNAHIHYIRAVFCRIMFPELSGGRKEEKEA